MARSIKSLPIGATLIVPGAKYHKSPTEIVLRKIADSHYGMGDSTLITDRIETLKSFDSAEPTNPNSGRRSNGNNQYQPSNVRVWLNSRGQGWYKGEHQYDAPPTKENVWNGHNPYDKEEGFLSSFPQEFVGMILTTSRQVLKPNDDGGGTISVQDKVFLLSRTEVGLGDENSGQPEGKPIPYFNSNDRRKAQPTAYAVEQSTYTNANLSESKAWYWWLSSPSAIYANSARHVYTDGTIHNDRAYIGNNGVRPALNLPSSVLVSDTPNSDGHYEVILNAAPTITSPQPENIGDKNTPFSINYTVTDGDNDKVKVVEKLNNTTLRTIDSITLGQQQTITLTWEQWQSLPSDRVSTIEISANDGQETTVKRFTFTKRNNRPTITLNVKDNETYYEGSTLNISGTAEDKDIGDAVIVNYKIADSRERVIATVVSDAKPFDYGKVLTFTKSRFYDGNTAVTDTLVEGQTYTLEVWAQDNKNVLSPVQTRKFKVVPNRAPLIEVTKTPTLEGGSLTQDLTIEGKVNDPDGDDVRLTYRLNGGKETPINVSDDTFHIDFKLGSLRVGRNTFLIIARDEYDAMTTREVEVTINAVESDVAHIKSKLYYKVDTAGVETDGILMWLRRPLGDDTDYKASLSIGDPASAESYKPMNKTTSIVQGHNRDEFTGTSTKGSDVRIKLEFDGSEAPVEMIQGVIK